jgi:hypothetical protein
MFIPKKYIVKIILHDGNFICSGGKFAKVDIDKAYDKNLVTAPAWPAHPDWLAKFLNVMGVKISL